MWVWSRGASQPITARPIVAYTLSCIFLNRVNEIGIFLDIYGMNLKLNATFRVAYETVNIPPLIVSM